ncbi:hypothetical protein G3N57_00485 [Paraburkholderia sp. Se-20369]|nr:hypothetical protein [Paraburkholderia sp. Se-20369]
MVALNIAEILFWLVLCFFIIARPFQMGVWQANLDREIIYAAADGDQCFMGVSITCLARVELLG